MIKLMVYKLIDKKDGQTIFDNLDRFEAVQIKKLMIDTDLIIEKMRGKK